MFLAFAYLVWGPYGARPLRPANITCYQCCPLILAVVGLGYTGVLAMPRMSRKIELTQRRCPMVAHFPEYRNSRSPFVDIDRCWPFNHPSVSLEPLHESVFSFFIMRSKESLTLGKHIQSLFENKIMGTVVVIVECEKAEDATAEYQADSEVITELPAEPIRAPHSIPSPTTLQSQGR